MVQLRKSSLFFVLALGDVVFGLSNSSLAEAAKNLTPANVGVSGRMPVDQWLTAKRRRNDITNKRKHHRSTSSESNKAKSTEGSDRDDSLRLSSKDSSDDDSRSQNRKNKYTPISTEERKGWRKWHRKCTPCPNDLKTRWRDPTISWICGSYQRARRSFKSECMMHQRNCQDGTMFVKIYDHRCKDDKTGRFGTHFFYEYFVRQTGETESGQTEYEDEEEKEESAPTSYEELRMKRRAGVSLQSRAYAIIPNGTTNNSVATDVQSPSGNLSTNIANIPVTEVIKTSKVNSRDPSKVKKKGNVSRTASNVTNVDHKARRTKITNRVSNGGLSKALRAVSDFVMSLANITAHHRSISHTRLPARRSKLQTNKQNHHIITT